MIDLTLTDSRMITLAASAALFAGFVRGFTGFGGPAVMILVLVQFYTPISVLPKIMLIDFVANLSLLPTTAKEVERRTTALMATASVVGLPLGLFALEVGDPVIMKRAVACTVAACTLSMILGWRFQHDPRKWIAVGIGLLAGVALGATGIALVAVAFFLARPTPANVSRANMVYWAVPITIALLGYHIAVGNLEPGGLWRAGLIGAVYGVAVIAGSRAFRASGERTYRGAVLWLLLALSIIGLLT